MLPRFESVGCQDCSQVLHVEHQVSFVEGAGDALQPTSTSTASAFRANYAWAISRGLLWVEGVGKPGAKKCRRLCGKGDARQFVNGSISAVFNFLMAAVYGTAQYVLEV